MLKFDTRQLSSQWPDGSIICPGRWSMTWLLAGSPWMLIKMEPVP